MKENLFIRIVKYTVKAIGLLLVFGTTAFFLWRVFSSGNPAHMEDLAVNAPVHEAWQAARAEGRELTVYAQETDPNKTITSAKHNYGYFAVTDVKFVEEAAQVQVLFRYNNSTIRHLVEDYGLDGIPDRAEELYDVTLCVAYDLTPDVHTDDDTNDPASVKLVRYHATSHTADQKNLYNYRRFIFDGVDMTVTDNPVLAVYVDIYYKGDIDYGKDAYGTLIIYDYAVTRVPYKLSKKDIRNLERYGA